MKQILFAALLLLALGRVESSRAAEYEVDWDAVQAAGELFAGNLDGDALEALGVDEQRVRQFLGELFQRLQGTSIYDLGSLRSAAVQWQPVLATYEETQPYAIWLKSRLGDFEVAEQLRADAVRVATNRAVLPPPTVEAQRRAWVRVVEARPAPAVTNRQVAALKKIFAEEGLPPQLVWLAEVESSFDARARSPAGAAGLFQLMPRTARSLDLSVGFFRDERLHPEKSARAAARYLRQLHQRFGDWRLALAAYNCGEGRVSALLKKHRGKSYDDINQFLPVETQMYLPKIEVTLRKREKIQLRDLPPPRAAVRGK